MAEEKKIEYELIADIGSGLVIARLNIADIKEQDINARIMKTEMYRQLVDNIKKRGQLESLPLCALTDKVEIISGHHRIRAAKDAGLADIIVILDVSGLNRSQIAAKQLAHNAISGFDDQQTIREITKLITDVDDMLESYIGKDILAQAEAELDALAQPHIEFDWKTIVFAFLPHQISDFQKLIEVIESNHPDFVGLAPVGDQKAFVEAIAKIQQFCNVKNTGAAVHAMIKATDRLFDDVQFDSSKEYVTLASLFGSAAIPKEVADLVYASLKQMIADGLFENKDRWKALTLWAAREGS